MVATKRVHMIIFMLCIYAANLGICGICEFVGEFWREFTFWAKFSYLLLNTRIRPKYCRLREIGVSIASSTTAIKSNSAIRAARAQIITHFERVLIKNTVCSKSFIKIEDNIHFFDGRGIKFHSLFVSAVRVKKILKYSRPIRFSRITNKMKDAFKFLLTPVAE